MSACRVAAIKNTMSHSCPQFAFKSLTGHSGPFAVSEEGKAHCIDMTGPCKAVNDALAFADVL